MVNKRSINEFCNSIYQRMKTEADTWEEYGNTAYFLQGDDTVMAITNDKERVEITVKGAPLELLVLSFMKNSHIEPDELEFTEGLGFYHYKII